MKRIEITVSPQGEARLETHGFSGSACRDASRLLEQALGVRSSEQLTSEFYQSLLAHESAQERHG